MEYVEQELPVIKKELEPNVEDQEPARKKIRNETEEDLIQPKASTSGVGVVHARDDGGNSVDVP